MPLENNATLQDVIQAQNEFIAEQSQKIAALETDNAEVLQNLAALSQRVYGYNHTDFAVKNLDALYEEIIDDNPGLADKSAVGFTALLKDGETVPTQGNIMFINGVQAQGDYTFSGENSASGAELVTVWYFENNYTLTANRPETDMIDVVIKAKYITPALSSDFFNHVSSVTSNVRTPNTFGMVGVRKIKNTDSGLHDDYTGTTYVEYTSYCESISGSSNNSKFKVSALAKKVYFPYLKTIEANTTSSQNGGIFYNMTAEIDFPILENVGGNNYANGTNAPFKNVPTVVLPCSVKTISKYAFYNNQNIRLDCKDATSIDTNWCCSTPTSLFSMCADWGATINIAVAAANWIKDDFISLFTDKLRDMDDDVKELKIPSAIYDSLTDEEFEIAENKGWTIGC